tara:strand:+ start:233 stop:1021 length:789 start_codon:yes stop_codon:yes gene_type:complete
MVFKFIDPSNTQKHGQMILKRIGTGNTIPYSNLNHGDTQMNRLGERIKDLMTEKGWSEGELARRAGLKQPTVHRIIAGTSKDPRQANVERIASALGVLPEVLRKGGGAAKIDAMPTGPSTSDSLASAPRLDGYVPVISWVQAGAFTCMDGIDFTADEIVPRPPGSSFSTFALRVRGQSMMPKYEPGLIIYVDPEVAPYDGDDVVALLTDHNEATFKQLVEEPGGGRMLKARNPAWPDPWIHINGNCQIIGVVVGSLWLRQPR